MRQPRLPGVFLFLLLCSFANKKKARLKLMTDFVAIPAGTCNIAAANEPARPVSISSFYMSKYEVSNAQYRQFLTEAIPGMTEKQRAQAQCDSLGWHSLLSYSTPLADYYFNHPAYKDYPVVNISYEGALLYCAWLEQQLQKENPGYEIHAGLPSREQFIRAAQGKRNQAMFPWGNFYLRNNRGQFLCNFKRVGDQCITRNPVTGQPEVKVTEYSQSLSGPALVTVNVKSFYPNDYGLYNMCGNAGEMISEKGICLGGSWNDYGGDVHIRSEAVYQHSAPTVGFRPVLSIREKSN